MSTADVSSSTAAQVAETGPIDLKLEVVVLPVSTPTARSSSTCRWDGERTPTSSSRAGRVIGRVRRR